MQAGLKRVAAIHDISGYGRSSLTVIIPIMSAMGIEVCPMPTRVLSNHTMYEDFSYLDLTDSLPDFIDKWKKLDIKFDCIYSGFLGSARQVDIVSGFIDSFKKEDTLVVIDPVMGDDGKLYKTFSKEFVVKMQELVKKADIITPNLTEAAFLLGKDSCPDTVDDQTIKGWLKGLSDMGPGKVLITSVPPRQGKNTIAVAAYDRDSGSFWKCEREKIQAYYSGTGDSFTSALTAFLLKGTALPVSVDKAMGFMSQCIKSTYGHGNEKEFFLESNLGYLTRHTPIGEYKKI